MTTVTIATGRLMIHHKNRSSHKALETLAMARSRRPYTQVNLPFSYHYHHRRSKGTSLPLPETRYCMTTRDEPATRQPKPNEKHTFCLFISYYYTHIYNTSQPKGTTSLQSILIDDNGTPATWTLVLFQQAIDRQDRTPVEGRFNYV